MSPLQKRTPQSPPVLVKELSQCRKIGSSLVEYAIGPQGTENTVRFSSKCGKLNKSGFGQLVNPPIRNINRIKDIWSEWYFSVSKSSPFWEILLSPLGFNKIPLEFMMISLLWEASGGRTLSNDLWLPFIYFFMHLFQNWVWIWKIEFEDGKIFEQKIWN